MKSHKVFWTLTVLYVIGVVSLCIHESLGTIIFSICCATLYAGYQIYGIVIEAKNG